MLLRQFDSSLGDRVATKYKRSEEQLASNLREAFFFAQIRALQTGKRQRISYEPRNFRRVGEKRRWMVQNLNVPFRGVT